MRASRGMGDINPSKMPKGKVKPRRDNTDFTQYAEGGKVGLYANINAKKKRIAAGSGEKMRKPGTKGAPTKADFIKSAKTARKK
jgi:glutamate mutase epsilon subunit